MDTILKLKPRSLPRRICSIAGVPLLSAALTFLLFLLMNLCYGIFPCGTNSIVWCDMEQQAVPLLLQFRQMVQNGESVWFSSLNAGGMYFYSVICFFLCNPFSLLILVTDISANQLVTLLVFLKLSLAAGTASFWFRSRIRNCSAAAAILLGMMYGCSGYGLFYYQNLMWLDVMLLIPLLMFSMRRMLKRGSPVPYLLTLSAIMITCFYISYMVIIFIVLYMTVSIRTTIPASERNKVSLRFLLASLFAGGIASVVWLPCLLQIMQSARGNSILYTLMHTAPLHHTGDKICLLGCTAIGFSALIGLWQKHSPRISSRKRDRLIFLLLAAAVILDPINTMWHGGSYQAFPLRWGMIPILLMLTLAGKQLSVQYEKDKTAVISKTAVCITLVVSFTAVIACALILYFTQGQHLYSYFSTLWVSKQNMALLLILMSLLAAAYLVIIWFRQNNLLSARVCTGLLAALFLCEFAFHFDNYIGCAANDDLLYTQTMQAENAVEPDDPTARIRMTKKYAHANMLGALGYPSLAHYTSLTSEDFLQGVKRFGYSSYWMEVSSTGGTVLSDAFWNVQYLLGVQADFPSWTTLCRTVGALSIAQSTMQIPAAHYTDQTPEEIAELPQGSRIDVQKALAKQIGGSADILTEYAPTSLNNVTLTTNSQGNTVCALIDPELPGEIFYSLFIPEHQALYFDLYAQTGTDLSNEQNGAAAILCNGKPISNDYPQNNSNGFLMLGEAEKEYVTIKLTVKHNFVCESYGVFGIATEPLAQAFQQTEGTALQYENGVYSAAFHTDHPQTMVLAATYNKGFSAEINGEPTEVYRVNDCQLAVRIPAGNGTVILRYRTPGLQIALIICGISIAAAILLYWLRRKIPSRVCDAAGRVAERIVYIGCALILLVIYIVPIALSLYSLLSAIHSTEFV